MVGVINRRYGRRVQVLPVRQGLFHLAHAANSPLANKKPAEQAPASTAQLQTAVDAANEFIKPINKAVEFSLDKDSDQMVVKVMDSATKEVIRQIPSVEMLAIAQALDKIQGLLIKQKA